MKRLFRSKFLSIKSSSILLLFLVNNSYAKEIELPKSSGDKGNYYLVNVEKTGSTFTVLHKRVGTYETVYSKTEINCSKKQFKGLGESEIGFEEITHYKGSNWVDILDGSSKAYLVNYICKNYK